MGVAGDPTKEALPQSRGSSPSSCRSRSLMPLASPGTPRGLSMPARSALAALSGEAGPHSVVSRSNTKAAFPRPLLAHRVVDYQIISRNDVALSQKAPRAADRRLWHLRTAKQSGPNRRLGAEIVGAATTIRPRKSARGLKVEKRESFSRRETMGRRNVRRTGANGSRRRSRTPRRSSCRGPSCLSFDLDDSAPVRTHGDTYDKHVPEEDWKLGCMRMPCVPSSIGMNQ